MNFESKLSSSFNCFAFSMALSDKSTPVHLPPSLAKESVSCPKWHCKCKMFFPFISPKSSKSIFGTEFFPKGNQ
jgi:alpha-D-ribose 1-methylphosphonate 5-triphosphate synthase subunit PhnH